MLSTRSKCFTASAERAAATVGTQVMRGGLLRFRPLYSLMMRSDSRQSSSMIQAS